MEPVLLSEFRGCPPTELCLRWLWRRWKGERGYGTPNPFRTPVRKPRAAATGRRRSGCDPCRSVTWRSRRNSPASKGGGWPKPASSVLASGTWPSNAALTLVRLPTRRSRNWTPRRTSECERQPSRKPAMSVQWLHLLIPAEVSATASLITDVALWTDLS